MCHSCRFLLHPSPALRHILAPPHRALVVAVAPASPFPQVRSRIPSLNIDASRLGVTLCLYVVMHGDRAVEPWIFVWLHEGRSQIRSMAEGSMAWEAYQNRRQPPGHKQRIGPQLKAPSTLPGSATPPLSGPMVRFDWAMVSIFWHGRAVVHQAD
jgi:hypothetical protein